LFALIFFCFCLLPDPAALLAARKTIDREGLSNTGKRASGF